MPPGLVENDHRMSAALNYKADLMKMRLHGRRIAIGHDEAGAFAFRRADGAENVSPLRALIVRSTRAGSALGPAAGYLVLLANAGFVLKPDLDLCAGCKPLLDRRQLGGEVFLKSAIASVSWA
jgi:hypothetical protein